MGKRKQDRWPELLRLVDRDDGLPVREVGSWTLDKLYFWHRYIDIATQALANSPKWPDGLVYVDLFGGPGVCVEKESRERFPGSALIAAHAIQPFRRIIVCEQDARAARACQQRLAASPVASNCDVLAGNCNSLINDVVARIPKGALTLAFVDPTGLHARFETIRVLTENRAVDLLILFPDALDAVRNVQLYEKEILPYLDDVLGPHANWRDGYNALPSHDGLNLRRYFGDLYQRQLGQQLAYRYFRDRVMPKDNPLYRLVFASRDPLGLKFWDQAVKRERRGQRKLFDE